MATYQLPFGYAEWPAGDPAADAPAAPAPERRERVTLRLPASLRRSVEASAALDGVPAETWIAHALARSVDPRLQEA